MSGVVTHLLLCFVECASEEFECNNGSCIFEKAVCDFIADCPDGEDELSCGE